MATPYVYLCTVESVYDADTCTVMASLGFATYRRVSVRLLGINARELHDPGGAEARAHLLELIPVGSTVVLTSVSVDKYGGRSDGVLTTPAGVDVAAQMVKDGMAAEWNGRGTKPVPAWPLKGA